MSTPEESKKTSKVLSNFTIEAMCKMYDRQVTDSSPWMVVAGATNNGEYLVERKISKEEAQALKAQLNELFPIPAKAEDKTEVEAAEKTDPKPQTFGSRLKELRKGLVPPASQEDIARIAGLSLAHYQKIEQEKGRPSIKALVSIAGAVGLEGQNIRSFILSYPFKPRVPRNNS